MSRSYRNISMYEQEILEMKSQGKTLQLINMNADMVAKFDKFYGVI